MAEFSGRDEPAQPQGGKSESERRDPAAVARAYARGVAGGLLVAMPLLMTMEMWWSGFDMPPPRMLLFVLFNFGVLLILERYSGFREDETFFDELEDAVVALGIGLVVSAVALFALNLLRPGMSFHELAGKIIIESIPVAIGASVARSQLGEQTSAAREQKRNIGFWGLLLIALAGAMFFGFNIAPTVEPMLLGLVIEWWHAILIVLLSLGQTYAIVYAVNFRGGKELNESRRWWEALLQNSTAIYAVALSTAAYLLWTFGRIGLDSGLTAAIHMTVVLGFVTSLGAAAAILIL